MPLAVYIKPEKKEDFFAEIGMEIIWRGNEEEYSLGFYKAPMFEIAKKLPLERQGLFLQAKRCFFSSLLFVLMLRKRNGYIYFLLTVKFANIILLLLPSQQTKCFLHPASLILNKI